jgi:hypothetical protein
MYFIELGQGLVYLLASSPEGPTIPTDDKDAMQPTDNATQNLLSAEDKLKITLEEQFRLEIRKQLEGKSHTSSRAWTFLNSTFGLWLMSAILVTWAGTIYTQSQNKRSEAEMRREAEKAEALRNKELVERLDLEIGYRFSRFEIRLYSLVNNSRSEAGRALFYGKAPSKTFLPFRSGKSESDVEEAIDSLSQPARKSYPALYQEFSNLSTLALIAELRRHVPSSEQGELDQVIADMSGIYIFLDVQKVKTTDAFAVGSAVFDRMWLRRWRAGRFYFSDCPFC